MQQVKWENTKNELLHDQITTGRDQYRWGTYVALMGNIYYIPSQLGPGLYPELINNP
jgi:hypothetical protein